MMLPHLAIARRPLRRYPERRRRHVVLRKARARHQPEWIETIEVPSKERRARTDRVHRGRATARRCLGREPRGDRVPRAAVARREGQAAPRAPDLMVFDLDPGPGTTIVECCRVAQWVAERLDRETLFAKTSGSKGCSSTRACSARRGTSSSERGARDRPSDRTRPPRQRRVDRCEDLREEQGPHRLEPEQLVEDDGRVYSLRARPEPTVSTP